MLPPEQSEVWAPQDIATNVQDWDRAAQKIATGLQADGLLPGRPDNGSEAPIVPPAKFAFYVRIQHETVFLHQLSQALEAEIISRNGLVTTSPLLAYVIDLNVDVIRWSSRSISYPYFPRREAVWGASINVGDRIIRAYREPFYIYDSDIPLYENMPDPGEAFVGPPRPLHYSTP